MTFLFKRTLLLAATGLIGLIALACSSGTSTPEAVPTSTSNATLALPPTSVPSPESRNATPVPSADDESTPGPYDPTATMYRVFTEFGGPPSVKSAAVVDILREGDISQVPVLIDAIRFTFDLDVLDEMAAALRELTGQDFEMREWDRWMEWLGKNLDDFRPPDGYVDWKINLLSAFDPRYTELLSSAEETSRIDMREIVWGGVVIDGIPDLRDPNIIPADEANYLEPDERVFGVSINGEHRAYPLRITNPHEMVNDVL